MNIYDLDVHRDPDQQAHRARRSSPGRGLQDRAREVHARWWTTSRSATKRAAHPGGHDQRREERRHRRPAAQQAGHRAQRAERQAPRARGADRGAGRPSKGAITMSTNMAGRGTDIVLGGNPEMPSPSCRASGRRVGPRRGGVRGSGREARSPSCEKQKEEVLAERRPLHHRHRAPRVTAHRQPAPWPRRPPGRPRAPSQFYLSLEDDLMRIFAGRPREEPDGEAWACRGQRAHRAPRGSPRAIENAQKKRGGAQLRHPQEPARVRRRDELAAQARSTSMRQELLAGRYVRRRAR